MQVRAAVPLKTALFFASPGVPVPLRTAMPGARGARVVLGRGQGAAKASDARAREGARARREERARGEIAAGVFR